MFEALHRVAMGSPNAGPGLQRRWPGPVPDLAELTVQGIEIGHPQVGGQGPDQGGIFSLAVAARHPGQGNQQIRDQIAVGRAAEYVQSAPDLGFLQFAEIVVDLSERLIVIVIGDHACIPVEAKVTAEIENFLPQDGKPPAVHTRRLIVLVDQRLQVPERAIALGAGQRRHQVIDDHRLGAPLGLTPLPGIVDDERINMGQRAENRFGIAFPGQGQRFARQPLHIAVLAKVDRRVRAKHMAKPEIKGEVAVRRHQIRIVIGIQRIDVVAPRRLHPEHHVPQPMDTKNKAAVLEEPIVPGRAPAFPDGRSDARRKPVPMGQVGWKIETDRTFRIWIRVGGAAQQEADNRGRVVRNTAAQIIPIGSGACQERMNARRRIQPDPVPEPAVPVGIVGDNHGDPAFRRRCPPQNGPVLHQVGDEIDAVRDGFVPDNGALDPIIQRLGTLEGDRAGENPAIHLRQCDIHGQVPGRKPLWVGAPGILVLARQNHLQLRRVGPPRTGSGSRDRRAWSRQTPWC